MVLRLFKAILVGLVVGTIHIATHLIFGDIDRFAEAGVYAAGVAVVLSTTIVSYLLLE